MRKAYSILALAAIMGLALASCQKEYSEENGGDANANIIGTDCRITRIGYNDSATGISFGALTAVINVSDQVTSVTNFDSLTSTLNFFSSPVYVNDTVYVDADEYFVLNASDKRVKTLHALLDPTDPFSPKIDVVYNYDASGYLVQKQYFFSAFPGIAYEQVDYTYTGGNLTHMLHTDLSSGDKVTDADITYTTIGAPKNFIYIFPDELTFNNFTQFFNFGKRPTNPPASIIVNNYDPGNVLNGSIVSTFSQYTWSVDRYILSCLMKGDDQPSIPALAGKLNFSYHCL